MRRSLGIGFLVLIVCTLAGVYPARWALQAMAREHMLSFIRTGGARSANLTRMSFNLVNGEVADEKFDWEEEDEFSYAGGMYDVVLSEVSGDVITFHCISDEKENDLLAIWRTIDRTAGTDRSVSGPGKSLIKFITDQYVADRRTPPATIMDPGADRVPTTRVLFSSGFEEVGVPPPRG